MIQINQIRVKCGVKHDFSSIAAKKLRLKGNVPFRVKIVRHSIDARKKPVLYDVYSLGVHIERGTDAERKLVVASKDKDILFKEDTCYQFPDAGVNAEILKDRPVIIGFGPAGLYCGLILAENGYRPIILERGRKIQDRTEDVRRFWESGRLDTISNIQFGEGGAGTFSDGKLNTNVKDKNCRTEKVLETFVRYGAPEDILYEFHPHIGTDLLRNVIVNMRHAIEDLGGEIRFETRAEEFECKEGHITGIYYVDQNGRNFLPAQVVVLANGHSARDTFRILYQQGLPMERKDFAVGFRVSHPQEMIDQRQYGISDPAEMKRLGLTHCSYKLVTHASSGRGVYSFCMCPGGYVINASSEEGHLAVNGMSDYARDSQRANSAIVLTVGAREAGSENVLAGMEWQQQIEEACYTLAGGRVPVENYKDFESKSLVMTNTEEDLCIKGAYSFAPLHELLPKDMTDDFIEAMQEFDRVLPGFASDKGFVIGLESRTSSPVRILRGTDLESTGDFKGLYPCGEGAGYAGGITSAAIDGIRVAEAIGLKWKPPFRTE